MSFPLKIKNFLCQNSKNPLIFLYFYAKKYSFDTLYFLWQKPPNFVVKKQFLVYTIANRFHTFGGVLDSPVKFDGLASVSQSPDLCKKRAKKLNAENNNSVANYRLALAA